MLAVVKAAGATVANGALQLVYQNAHGILTDVYAAAFQIWNTDLTAQVYPNSGRHSLVVGGADRLGPGRYAATWDASAQTTPVRLWIRWFLTPSNGDAEISFDQEFEVVTLPYRGPHYCTVKDLRDEGLSTTYSEEATQKRIVAASRYVELFTGRTFGPAYKVLELDGKGSRKLLLDEPIVAVEKVVVTFDSSFNPSMQETESDAYKVYNRHLTERLIQPDDRNSPKIEFIHNDEVWGQHTGTSVFWDTVLWPTGVRNIQVTGLFGYTEADASYTGQVPDLVREVTKMLVFDNLGAMSLGINQPKGSIMKERTRDQEVDYASRPFTTLTGNRNIDVLLVGFKRPPVFGAA